MCPNDPVKTTENLDVGPLDELLVATPVVVPTPREKVPVGESDSSTTEEVDDAHASDRGEETVP
jgi:hypothetical protein